jgi:purine-binding chemotaxis protein CheW
MQGTTKSAQGTLRVKRQIITFCIGDLYLGADIMAIREIRAWSATTPIPHSPDYLCGVVNLRGSVVPVLDLSQRLGFGRTEPSERHVIIVMEIGNELNGMIVDAVNDIATIDDDDLQPQRDLGEAEETKMVEGVIMLDERLVIILTLDRLTTFKNSELQEAA